MCINYNTSNPMYVNVVDSNQIWLESPKSQLSKNFKQIKNLLDIKKVMSQNTMHVNAVNTNSNDHCHTHTYMLMLVTLVMHAYMYV